MKAARRAWFCVALLAASGCEYFGAIGVLAGEYRSEENEKATRLEQCGECPAGQRCNLLLDPGECRPDPGVEHDPCGSWKDREDPEHTFGCANEWICNGALDPPTCAAPGGVGHPCHASEHCQADTYCDSSSLACRTSLTPGSACTFFEECRPLTCHVAGGNVCAKPGGSGEPCENGMDCGPELGCSDQGRCIDLNAD